nr:MAG TPA: Terminase small subunit [Caudoviricetes sp.]
MKKGLTIKQEKFCNKYLECGNASEAYRYAYNCLKMSDNSVWCNASQLLSDTKVIQRIKELQSSFQKRTEITKERVLNELVKIGFSSIAYMHNSWIDRVEFDQLTDDQKACIKSIQTKVEKRSYDDEVRNVEMVKIELYDKLAALNSINKMLGFDAPAKVDANVTMSRYKAVTSDGRIIDFDEIDKDKDVESL